MEPGRPVRFRGKIWQVSQSVNKSVSQSVSHWSASQPISQSISYGALSQSARQPVMDRQTVLQEEGKEAQGPLKAG